MGDTRAPLDEATIRETREELVDGHVELQAKSGKVPSRRAAEDFVDPIVGKVVREADDTRHAGALKPDAAPSSPTRGDRTLQAGEWYGEPGHSPRVPEPTEAGEKVSLFQRNVGTVIFDKATGTARTVDGRPLQEPQDQMSMFRRTAIGKLVAMVLEKSSADPEWRERWKRLAWFSGLSKAQRAVKTMELVDDWIRLHGDPRKPRDRKIIVNG